MQIGRILDKKIFRGFAPARGGRLPGASRRAPPLFGKRAQNHFQPGVPLRAPCDVHGLRRVRNSLRLNCRRQRVEFGTPAQPRPRRKSKGDNTAYNSDIPLSPMQLEQCQSRGKELRQDALSRLSPMLMLDRDRSD